MLTAEDTDDLSLNINQRFLIAQTLGECDHKSRDERSLTALVQAETRQYQPLGHVHHIIADVAFKHSRCGTARPLKLGLLHHIKSDQLQVLVVVEVGGEVDATEQSSPLVKVVNEWLIGVGDQEAG